MGFSSLCVRSDQRGEAKAKLVFGQMQRQMLFLTEKVG